MKKVIFGTALVLGTIFTSCDSQPKTQLTPDNHNHGDEANPVETTTVTTPSVDTSKVKELKQEDKK
jgi:hypothetical protein